MPSNEFMYSLQIGCLFHPFLLTTEKRGSLHFWTEKRGSKQIWGRVKTLQLDATLLHEMRLNRIGLEVGRCIFVSLTLSPLGPSCHTFGFLNKKIPHHRFFILKLFVFEVLHFSSVVMSPSPPPV